MGMNGIVALYHAIKRHRILCFVFTALCWGFAAYAVVHMRQDTGILPFFPDDDVHARAIVKNMDMLPASRLLFVDISTESTGKKYELIAVADAVARDIPEDLARPAFMNMPKPQAVMGLLPYFFDDRALRHLLLASEAKHIEKAIGSASNMLANVLTVGPAKDWLRADPLASRSIILSRLPTGADTAILPDPATGYPVTADEKHVLLTLRFLHSIHNVDAATRFMEALDRSLRVHLAPDMHVLVVGGLQHSAINARVIRQDVTNIVGISLVCFCSIYVILVRSAGAVWLLLLPCFAATVALATMSLAYPVLSGLALGFGASVLGVAEDYAVHMHFALRCGRPAEQVLPIVSPPLLQSFLLNASGFVVLMFSGIPAVRQLACFALLTLGIGFVLAVTLLPVCPWFSTPMLHKRCDYAIRQLPVLWRVTCSVCFLLGVGIGLYHLLRIDVSPRTLGAEVSHLQQESQTLQRTWGMRERHAFVVEGQTREEALELAREMTAVLRTQAPHASVSTLTAFLPTHEELRNNVQRWITYTHEHGVELREKILAAGELYGFSAEAFDPFLELLRAPVATFDLDDLRAAGFGDLLDTFVPVNPTSCQVQILLYADSHVDISFLEPHLAAYVSAIDAGSLESMLLRKFEDEKHLVPVAWLVCLVLLFLDFRDIRQALLASLPPLCSITCILAWMAASGHSLTLAGMAAMPMVLGLAADHGILVTHDLANGVRTGVERAILVSSLTTLTGMGLLALAQHPALRSMGEVIFWGLLIESPAALWLLPRLCAPTEETTT